MVTLAELARVVLEAYPRLSFTLLEVGALPVEGQTEPSHQLLDAFPGSRILAFELDRQLCAELNRKAKRGIRFYPAALGRAEETRPLYEAAHPMCTSLYKPNEALLARYFNLEVAMLKAVASVQTVSLDRFAVDNAITGVDFIKIDVQGAELDVFTGGVATLGDVVLVVSEVEFVPLYLEQPLFGDVCRFLSEQGLMFHKFLGMAGRALKPNMMNDDPNFAIQHMWSDAVFVRDILKLDQLPPEKLLKLAVLSHLYRSPDLMFHCLELFDRQSGTQIIAKLLDSQG